MSSTVNAGNGQLIYLIRGEVNLEGLVGLLVDVILEYCRIHINLLVSFTEVSHLNEHVSGETFLDISCTYLSSNLKRVQQSFFSKLCKVIICCCEFHMTSASIETHETGHIAVIIVVLVEDSWHI